VKKSDAFAPAAMRLQKMQTKQGDSAVFANHYYTELRSLPIRPPSCLSIHNKVAAAEQEATERTEGATT
jgi:hypothetical protein